MTSCTDITSDVVYAAVYRGDTLRLSVDLGGADGTTVDVTGWAWRCQLRKADDSLAGLIAVRVVDAPSGRLELGMTAVETAALAAADYAFDLEATDAASDVRTVLTGQLRVRTDVSR